MEIGLLELPRPCPLAHMRFRVCCGDLPGLMAPRDAWAQLCSPKMCGGAAGSLRRDSRNGSLQAGGPAAGKRVRAAVAASLFPLEEVAPGVCVWPLAQRTVGRGKSARGARGGDRAHHLLQRPEARAGACVAGRQNPIPATDVGSSRAWIGC